MLWFRGRSMRLSLQESAVLEYLAKNPSKTVTPEQIAGALWPGKWPEDWLPLIQHIMVRVRKALPSGHIVTMTERVVRTIGASRSLVGWRLAADIKIDNFLPVAGAAD